MREIVDKIKEVRASDEWANRLHLCTDEHIAAAIRDRYGLKINAKRVREVREQNRIPSEFETFQELSKTHSWDGSKWRRTN